METEIAVALIGVVGVVVAALIAAFTTIYSKKESNHPTDDKVDRSNENAARIADENSHAKYLGNLVDFVEGATDENPLKVEIAVNGDIVKSGV